MEQVWWLAAAVVVGALAAVWARPWVVSRGYRYEDERDLPLVPVGWAIPVSVLVSAGVGLAWVDRPALMLLLVLVGVTLVVLAAIDVDVRRLPDRLTKPLALGCAVGLLLVALAEGDIGAWGRALAAGVVLGVLYLVLVIVGGGSGMGLGDAKLAPSLGMILGYLSWGHVLLGTMAGFLSGGLVAVVLLMGGAGRKAQMPFGPHMIGGVLLVLLLPVAGRL